MDPTLAKTLREVFGFHAFRPGQSEIIGSVMAGRSALAVFPTGSGKSLCYQLPGCLLPGLTLVVSPLLALMKDQVDFLRRKGVAAARLDSTLTYDAAREVYREARSGQLKLLYVAPERVSNERFLAGIAGAPISMMVIDEAHCISEWGHNFRPEYLKLSLAARQLNAQRVLALTATATPRVVEDIRAAFDIAPGDYVNTGFYRPNLHLAVSPTPFANRIDALIQRLRSRPPGPTIVYVTLQKTAEHVANQLSQAGFNAQAYHAGMQNDERESIQETFMASRDAIVVATIAFGMGIDKADIRSIYHYNLPKTLENYSQEIGRAGRDGQPAHCEILGDGEDLVVLENFVYGDTPEPKAVNALVRHVLRLGERFDVAVHDLARDFDIRPLVVKTLLTYLELEGALRFLGHFFAAYQYRFLEPEHEILAHFDPKRRAFLHEVFQRSQHRKKWSRIDLSAAAQAMGEDRRRLVKALQYLEETGRIEVQASEARLSYRRLGQPDIAKLADALAQRVQANEEANLRRTAAMVESFSQPGCRSRRLLAYFGETRKANCGHCDACQGEQASRIERLDTPALDSRRLQRLAAEHAQALPTPRALARFLCGITSPAITKARLSKHPDFGRLAQAPFAQILAQAQAAHPG